MYLGSLVLTTSLTFVWILASQVHNTTNTSTEPSTIGDPWSVVVGDTEGLTANITTLPVGESRRRANNLVENIRRQLMLDNYDYESSEENATVDLVTSSKLGKTTTKLGLRRAPSFKTSSRDELSRYTVTKPRNKVRTASLPPAQTYLQLDKSVDEVYNAQGVIHKRLQVKNPPLEHNASNSDLLFNGDYDQRRRNNDLSESDGDKPTPHKDRLHPEDSIVNQTERRRNMPPTRRSRKRKHRKRIYALGNDRKMSTYAKRPLRYVKYWDEHQFDNRRRNNHLHNNYHQKDKKKDERRDSQIENKNDDEQNNGNIHKKDAVSELSIQVSIEQQKTKYDDEEDHHDKNKKENKTSKKKSVLRNSSNNKNDGENIVQDNTKSYHSDDLDLWSDGGIHDKDTYNIHSNETDSISDETVDEIHTKDSRNTHGNETDSISNENDHEIHNKSSNNLHSNETNHIRNSNTRAVHGERRVLNKQLEHDKNNKNNSKYHSQQDEQPNDLRKHTLSTKLQTKNKVSNQTKSQLKDDFVKKGDEKVKNKYKSKHDKKYEIDNDGKLSDNRDNNNEPKDVINSRRMGQDDLEEYKKYVEQIRSSNVKYKLLKVQTKSKSRRSGASGPRRFLQERGAHGVALISLDAAPFPQFRLPHERRQYMHEHGDHRPPLAEYLPHKSHHRRSHRPVTTNPPRNFTQ